MYMKNYAKKTKSENKKKRKKTYKNTKNTSHGAYIVHSHLQNLT